MGGLSSVPRTPSSTRLTTRSSERRGASVLFGWLFLPPSLSLGPLGDSDALLITDIQNMNDIAISYEFHSVTKRTRYIISFLCAAACLWAGFHARTALLAFISVAFAFGAIAVQVDQRVCIDSSSREVFRQISLWGRRLWSSHRSLDDFTEVAAYRLPSGTPQAPADLVHVGLRRSTGSILAIRYFSTRRGQPCPEAEAFARGLEATTHLHFYGVA